jgi:hypothetical protein
MSLLPKDPAPGALARCWRTPERGCQRPGHMLSRGLRIKWTELIGNEILPTHGCQDGGKGLVRIAPGSSFFRLVVSPLQSGVVGPYPVRGMWFPSLLPLERTGLYPVFWVITGGLWYPGYKTQTVGPEPSVKRVAVVVHSTEGRIVTHMSLWVPPRDSVVRPWG